MLGSRQQLACRIKVRVQHSLQEHGAQIIRRVHLEILKAVRHGKVGYLFQELLRHLQRQQCIMGLRHRQPRSDAAPIQSR